LQIRDYWVVLSKRWWLIVLVAAAATVSSYGYCRLQTPIYRSEIQLTVAPSRLDYGLTLVIDNLLTQYQQQLLTRQLAASVNDNLQLDLPIDTLLGKIRASAVTNGYLLDITVDDSDPNRARDIALVWAEQFIQNHQAEMAPKDPQDRIDITMLDKPIPGTIYFPKTKQYVLGAGVLGLVVGAVFAFLLEYLDDTLKTAEDVERYTGLTALGAIPVAADQSTTATRSSGLARAPLTTALSLLVTFVSMFGGRR
jgi:capsular polysaccharide biosynthesis protein